MTLTLKLPLPPNIANKRMHWRVKYNKQQEYYAACDHRQRVGLIPPPPERPFSRARIHVVLELARMMDTGNAMHRAEKWPCDWLKTRGYIVDDSPTHLEWSGFPEQSVKRRPHYHVLITLTPIAA